MNIYLVGRIDTVSFDEYDSFIIACDTPYRAAHTHPEGMEIDENGEAVLCKPIICSWTKPSNVVVLRMGVADPGVTGILLTSFNAG